LHVNGKAKLVEHEDLMKFRKDLPKDIIDEMNAEGKHRPERWIMVEIEEAYIHCSKHIPLLKKAEKDITWGTDDDALKRSDFFALQDIPLYQRIGGDSAIQAITESLTRKLLQDGKLSPFMDEIKLQTLLDRQGYFLKTMFNAQGTDQELPENLREFYRKQTHSNMNDSCLDIALGYLKKTMTELDVPEHEILKLMASLERKSNA
jgi:truncated hemoglobin YjbI